MLMELAENYYRDAIVRQVWQTKSKEFIALEARINRAQAKPDRKKKDKSQSKKNKGKKDDGNDKPWAWKKLPPKDKAPKTKEVNGKTYHWCPWAGWI